MLNIFRSRFFIVAGTIALLLFLVFLGRELNKKYQINKEVKNLEKEIAEIEARNEEIAQLIDYLNTPEYKERQARSLLNLQKPGEFAVALPLHPEEQEQGALDDQSKRQASNFQKWWNYFFKKRP